MLLRRSSTGTDRLRLIGATFALLFLLGGAAACSSDSDSKKDTSTETTTAADGTSGENAAELPAGFPADVPLPDFQKVDIIKEATDALPDSWVVMLTVDPSLETDGDELIDSYAEQLVDAGYEVDDSGPAVTASNDDWELSFHSSLDGTLTVSTMPV